MYNIEDPDPKAIDFLETNQLGERNCHRKLGFCRLEPLELAIEGIRSEMSASSRWPRGTIYPSCGHEKTWEKRTALDFIPWN